MQDMVLALMLLTCLLTDLRERKMYNAIILPVLIFGLVYNFAETGWPGLHYALTGLLLGLGILILPFAAGGMGAGDVKLLAAIGAVKGPLFLLYTAAGMALAGGIIALALLIYRRRLLDLIKRLARGLYLLMATRCKVIAFELNREQIMFPYGVAIVAGAVSAFWWMG